MPIASYKSHWGGGTLTLADGSRFVLACSGVWNQPWSLLDGNGDTFLRVDPRSLHGNRITGRPCAVANEAIAAYGPSEVLPATVTQ